MTRQYAIKLIDAYKNALINPVEILDWTWMRTIINHISDDAWTDALDASEDILRR